MGLLQQRKVEQWNGRAVRLLGSSVQLLQASLTTAHTLIVGAVCGVMLGTALWWGAPSLVAGQHSPLGLPLLPHRQRLHDFMRYAELLITHVAFDGVASNLEVRLNRLSASA